MAQLTYIENNQLLNSGSFFTASGHITISPFAAELGSTITVGVEGGYAIPTVNQVGLIGSQSMYATQSLYATSSISASYANTSSWATAITFVPTTTVSASWVSASVFIITAQTASYISSSNIIGIVTALSASWASASISASYSPVEPAYSSSVSTQFGTKQPNLVTGNTYTITSSWSNNSVFSIGSTSSSYASASTSASFSPINPAYSASVSSQFGTKQDTLVTGNTYTITSSWSNNAVTASYANTASYAISLTIITSSIQYLQATGSLFGTASWSNNSLTASYVSSSNIIGNVTALSASWASASISSSFSTTAGTANAISFVPTTAISASWVSASVRIYNADTASYVTASNVIGKVASASLANTAVNAQNIYINTDTGTDYQPIVFTQFDGAFPDYNVVHKGSASYQPSTDTLRVTNVIGTASLAKTASYVSSSNIIGNITALSSSWSSASISASYASTAGALNYTVAFATTATSASWASASISASYAPVEPAYSASVSSGKQNTLTNTLYVITASLATSASYVSSSNIVGYVTALSSSWASASISASYSPVQPSYSASVSTQFGTKQDTLVVGNTYTITSSWSNNSVFSIGTTSSSYASASTSASFSPINPSYSASVSSQFGTKQDTLVTGNTYTITSSWSNNSKTASVANNASISSTVAGGANYLTFITAAASLPGYTDLRVTPAISVNPDLGSVTATTFNGALNGNALTATTATTAATASSADAFHVRGNATIDGVLIASQLSSSNIYITSSYLIATDNILQLNAQSPHLRYAGLELFDSGSTAQSAFFLWDGLNNYFLLSSSDAGWSRKIVMGPANETDLTPNYVPLADSFNSLKDSVIYQSASNVGIGTIIPGTKLSLGNSVATVDAAGSKISVFDAGGSFYGIGLSKLSTNYGLGLFASKAIVNGVPDVFIDSINGNVGIGTTNPLGKLVVSSTAGAGISTGDLVIQNPTAYADGVTREATIAFKGNNISNNIGYPSAYIKALITPNQFSNDPSGDLTFWTDYGAIPPYGITEKMRIQWNGNVGIGLTSSIDNKLTVAGNISCSVITASLLLGTASLAKTASRATIATNAQNIYINTDTGADYQPIVFTQFDGAFPDYNVLHKGSASYQPSTDTLRVTNVNGTASRATTASYALTASNISGISGSNILYLHCDDNNTYEVTLTNYSGSVVFSIGQTPVTNTNTFINIGTVGIPGLSGSWASSSISSSYASTASYALNAGGSSNNSSSWASASLSSSYPWFQTGSNIAYVGGNVGIGTATPTASLEVVGELRFAGARNTWYANDSGPYIFRTGGSAGDFGAEAGHLAIQARSTTGVGRGIIFGTGETSIEKMRITNTGYVGIGLTAPTAKLHISGSVASETLLNVQSNTGTTRLFVSSSGNVGIGTTSPTYLFSVGNKFQIDISGGYPKIYYGSSGGIAGVTDRAVSSDDLYWGETSDTGKYIFRGSGNTTFSGKIGIGLTNPTNSLDVSGNISCSVITASLFNGTANTASVAKSASISSTVAGGANYLTFITAAASLPGYTDLRINTGISTNPDLGSITATTFNGALNGNASTATTAYTASTLTDYPLDITRSVVISTANTNYVLLRRSITALTSAFYEYSVTSASNARAGRVMSIWTGTANEYTDTSTGDIGNTTDLYVFTEITGGNVQLVAYSSGSTLWNVTARGTYL